MPRFFTPLLLFFLLLMACHRDAAMGLIQRELAPPIQRFPIQIGRDTLVRCAGGTVLRFCANTFISKSEHLTIEVREVKNRGQAMLAGMGTIASNGRLLATEGMVWINAVAADGAQVGINPNCGIEVLLPALGRRAGVRLFKGRERAGALDWEEDPSGLVNKTDIANLETGQQLFESLCTQCHCRLLDGPLTGPALGNIHLYREGQWLRDFTHHSQGMINAGDSLALCSWEKYRPMVMPAFPQLTDAQVDAIYQFVAEESARLKLTLGAEDYNCLPVRPVNYQVEHTSGDSAGFPILIQNARKMNPYLAKIYSLGWYNADFFVGDTLALPTQIFVSVPDMAQYDEVVAGILFKAWNANVMLEAYGDVFSFNRKDVKLPHAPVRLVVFGLKGKKWYLTDQAFTLAAINRIEANLQPVTRQQLDALIQSAEFEAPAADARFPVRSCGAQ